MTIEELMAAMQTIIDNAAGRSLNDAECAEYERLEAELSNVQRTNEIQARQRAYAMPINAGVHVGIPRVDDTREKAFLAYLRTGQPNADISDLRVNNAQGEGSSAGGGYTVPDTFRQKLVERMKAFGGIAPLADEFTTGDGRPVDYPTLDDTANSGDVTAESAAVASGADLTFGTVQLGAYKYTSAGAGSNLPLRVPVELAQDSAFDIAGLVSRKLGERVARKEAAHMATGTGVGQPLGLVASTLTADKTLTTLSTLTYADFLAAEALLDPAYEPNASWLMNKAAWNATRGVVDTAGRPLILAQATSGMSSAPPKMLLDYPVTIVQEMPAYNTASKYFAVLGDIREAYVVRRVAPLVIIVNPYSRASFGEIEYHAWERIDATVQNRNAYVIVGNHA